MNSSRFLVSVSRPLNSERIDPETLASFLDGTLPDAERERVLEALARGGAAYDDFVEARALLDKAAADEGVPQPGFGVPIQASETDVARPKPNVWWRSRRPWAIAAVLAAASIVAVLVLNRPASSDSASSALLAVQSVSDSMAGVTDLDARIGAPWDEPRWTVLRGSEESFNAQAYSFRLGVSYARFRVVLSAQDSRFRRQVSSALARLAARAETGAPVAVRIEQLAMSSAAQPHQEELLRVASELRGISAPASWFDLGVWTESARLAAKAGDLAFFDSRSPTMSGLPGIVGALGPVPTNDRNAVEGIVNQLRRLNQRGPNAPNDLIVVAAVLDSVIIEAGR